MNRNKIILLIILCAFAILLIITSISSLFDGANIATSSSKATIIELNGEITSQNQAGLFSSGLSSQKIVQKIQDASQDRSVAAVVFEINSPGGTPVASHEIVKAIKNLEKPSVAVIRDVGASGAYWAASAADHIIADELSLTGSVGVLAAYLEYSQLLENYNVTYKQITGGEYKDIGSPFRELKEDEEILLKNKIDLMHEFFVNDVAKNRNLTQDQIENISTGIYYIGIEALDVGLVDELGGITQAKQYLENRLDKKISLSRNQERTSLIDAFAGLNFGLEKIFTTGLYLK